MKTFAIGDICDGYPEVRQCIDELLKIRHCDLVIGSRTYCRIYTAGRRIDHDDALAGAMHLIAIRRACSPNRPRTGAGHG